MPRNYKVVGHRGDPENYPENTLAGVYSAIDAGVDAVEVDIQLSRDGVCILMHDQSLVRTSGVDKDIGELSAAELSAFSVHEPGRFGDRFLGTPLLTLKQFSTALKDGVCKIFIELKPAGLTRYSPEHFALAAIADSQALAGRRTFISFEASILEHVSNSSELPVGWILDKYDEHSLRRAEKLMPDILIINKKLLPNDDYPLWPGNWHWFVYDSVDKTEALALVRCGVRYIESWNPRTLL